MKARFLMAALTAVVSAALFLPDSEGHRPRVPKAGALPMGRPPGPRTVDRALAAPLLVAAPAASGPCREMWRTLARWDLDRLVGEDLVRAVRSAPRGACRITEGDPLAAVHAAFEAACDPERLAIPDTEDGRVWAEAVHRGGACTDALRNYRLGLLRAMHGKTPLEAFRDSGTLVSLAYAEVVAGKFDPDRLERLIRRARELDPENPLLAELAFRNRYNAWRFNGQEGRDENALEVAARDLESLAPARPVLKEMKLAVARETGDVRRMEALAREEWETNPGSEVGGYYLAWSRYLEGDSAGARSLLEEVRRAHPESSRVGYTLAVLETGAPQGQPLFIDDAGAPFPADGPTGD